MFISTFIASKNKFNHYVFYLLIVSNVMSTKNGLILFSLPLYLYLIESTCICEYFYSISEFCVCIACDFFYQSKGLISFKRLEFWFVIDHEAGKLCFKLSRNNNKYFTHLSRLRLELETWKRTLIQNDAWWHLRYLIF